MKNSKFGSLKIVLVLIPCMIVLYTCLRIVINDWEVERAIVLDSDICRKMVVELLLVNEEAT